MKKAGNTNILVETLPNLFRPQNTLMVKCTYHIGSFNPVFAAYRELI